MSFICEKCNVGFSTKQSLQNHTIKQACKISNYFCKHCGKGYTTETSMYRHMRRNCKVKKNYDKEKEDIYKKLVDLEESNKKLNQKVISMEKTIKKTNSIKNINKGIVNNVNNPVFSNINVILTGYGQEDMSKFDNNDLVKAVQNGFNSSIRLTEAIHFNPKYPEYHNIYISNMKDKYAMMFDGKNWALTIRDKIYEDKKNYIEENIDMFLDSLSESRKNALERWLSTSDDDNKIAKIKEQIKLLLYNKRHIVMATHMKDIKGKKKGPIKTIKDVVKNEDE
jgi:hypothetical protein